jgi:hypothetical protein
MRANNLWVLMLDYHFRFQFIIFAVYNSFPDNLKRELPTVKKLKVSLHDKIRDRTNHESRNSCK